MTGAYPSGCAGSAIGSEGGRAAALGAADWLRLAAAPIFAIMALLSGALGDEQHAIFCSAGDHSSPLSGMVPMYLLMSAFHSPPWLTLIAGRRNGARRA